MATEVYADDSHLIGDAGSSYLFGNDTGGWGPRFFFTFYSEFPEGGANSVGAATSIELSALLATLAASLASNGAVVWAVLWRRRRRKRHGGSVMGSSAGGASSPRGLRPSVTDAFLLNLAAADLVFALGIPLVAFTRVTRAWKLGDIACRLLPYSQFVCGFVLLWTLALISMDRHRCIAVPPYRSRLTPRTALALSASAWFLALTIFIPVPFWFRQQVAILPPSYQAEGSDGLDYTTTTICTVVFPRDVSDRLPIPLSLCFTVPVLLLAVFLPMGLLVYHYHRIFREVAATRSRWRRRLPSAALSCPPLPSEESSQRRDSDMSFVGIWAAGLPWRKNSATVAQQGPRGSVISQAAASAAAASQVAQQREEARLRRHLRVVRLLLLNVGVVVAMWLPIAVVALLIYADGRRPNEDTRFFLKAHHFVWALAAALLNTVVNPLLYGLLSHPFRRACRAGVWKAALCCGGKRRVPGCFSAETAGVVGAGVCLGAGDLKGRKSIGGDGGDFGVGGSGVSGMGSRTPTGSALLIGFTPHTPGGSSSRGCGRSSGSVASGPEGSTGD